VTTKSRCIALVAPLCARHDGHFIDTVAGFERAMGDLPETTTRVFVSANLNEPYPENWRATLLYNYGYFLGTSSKDWFNRVVTRLRTLARPSVFSRVIRRGVAFPILHSISKRRALVSVKVLVNDSAMDTLFFPEVDQYSLWALVKLHDEIATRNIRLVLRFSAWPEHFYYGLGSQAALIRNAKAIAKRYGAGVKFSAETEAHREQLSALGVPCIRTMVIPHDVAPIDDNTDGDPRGVRRPLTVGVVGAPRLDKGYFDLLEIAQILQKMAVDVEFLVQTRGRSARFEQSDYEHKLSLLPNVSTIEGPSSTAQYAEHLRRCDLVLLPYHPGAYKYKGSGVLFDCWSRGIPVIVRDGVSIAIEVAAEQIGFVFSSTEELGELLNALTVGEYRPRLKQMSLAIRDQWKTRCNESMKVFV
jgi:glycosyltransferase involved in cell wall biosynthesis